MRYFIIALLLCVAGLLSPATAQAELFVDPVFDADDHPQVIVELVVTVNDVAREFPEIRGAVITTKPIDQRNVYAYTSSLGVIVLNDALASDPSLIQQAVDYDVSVGHHPSLGKCTAIEYLAYHEAAHLIDFANNMVAQLVVIEIFGDGSSLRDQLPKYAFGPKSINPPEALAEAFASVKCNGGNQAEQALYQILTGGK